MSTGPARADDDGARRAFDELARLMVDQPLEQFLQHVVDLAPRVLPGVDDVSITLVEDGEATSAAFTSPTAVALDERQYEAGHGPCLDAAASGATIRVDVAGGDDRYRAFVEAARRQGVRGSVALGMPAPHRTVGALNLHSRTGAVGDGTVLVAQTFAAYAAVALANACLYDGATRRAEQFQEAMRSRAVIEQAKGIVMALHQVDEDAAFAHLSEASQTSNTKLRVLAADVVARAQRRR